jgi:putative ABC transport system permease protein
MYILQNAGKNIGRNKGRNILMGIIILAIIATSAVALIINNTATGIIDNYKERFSSEVSLTPNMQKLQEEMMSNMSGGGSGPMRFQMPQIPSDQYVAFGESEYLKETRLSAVASVNSENIKPIDEEKGGGMGGGGMMIAQRVGDNVSRTGIDGDNDGFYAKLMGYNFTPEEFTNGSRQIADGRFPEADNECIISRDLLENSGLNIGDVIIMTGELTETLFDMERMDERETRDIGFTLTIVGY